MAQRRCCTVRYSSDFDADSSSIEITKKSTPQPPSIYSVEFFSTFKGWCTKDTENYVKLTWHWKKKTFFSFLVNFPYRFKTNHGWNKPRHSDTYLRAFFVTAIFGGRLLITFTSVDIVYMGTSFLWIWVLSFSHILFSTIFMPVFTKTLILLFQKYCQWKVFECNL